MMAAASARTEGAGHVGTSASDGIIISATTKPEHAMKMDGADGNAFSCFNQRCDCCPYGYHIDLDFLHFLDSLNNAETLKTLKRFRRGPNPLLSSPHPSSSSDLSPSHESAKETENRVFVSEGDAVSPRQTLDEIDSSLCRTTTSATSPSRIVCFVKQKQTTEEESSAAETSASSRANVLIDGPTVSESPVSSGETVAASVADGTRPVSRMEVRLASPRAFTEGGSGGVNLDASSSANGIFSSASSFEGIFDGAEGGGRASPSVLQAIREQLVVSLRRMKELEEQVKVIPILQSRISMLKEENSLLTLTAAATDDDERTYRDASVGDFSLVNDDERVHSSESALHSSSFDGANGTSSSSSQSISHSVDLSDPGNSLTSGSMVSTHTIVMRQSSNSKLKTGDACVGTDFVPEPVKEFKSVGTLSKVSTSDSCIGTSVESVDCGAGDDSVLTDLTTAESSETVSEFRSAAISSSIKTEAVNLEISANDTFSSSRKVNQSESCSTDIIDVERVRMMRAPHEDDDIANRIDCSKEGDFQNIRHLRNDKYTQTDDFLLSEYASEILKLGNRETELRKVGETQADAKSSSPEVSKKRITFGKVTIYEADAPTNKVFVIDDNSPTGVDAGSRRLNETQTPKDLRGGVTSYPETQDEPENSSSSSADESPVECFVVEQVLESSQCGESVLIDDSNDESSAASSDSEDSAALSVLEVIPGGAAAASIRLPRAVKSVDEYFDEGIAVEESVAASDVITGDEVSEEEEETEAVVGVEKALSLETEKKPTELTEASEDSAVEAKTRFSFEESSENSKASANDVTASSLSVEIAGESVIGVNGAGGEAISSSSPSDAVVVVDAESLKADGVSVFSSPATDHREMFLSVKKRPKHTVTVSAESHLSSAGEGETESVNQVTEDIVCCKTTVSDGESLDLDDVTRSSVVRKKIVITEKRIERRRINGSGVFVEDDRKAVSMETSRISEEPAAALEFASENLTENDRSIRETEVTVGHGTEQTADSKRWEEDAEAAQRSVASDQLRKFLDQPAQSDRQDDDQMAKDDFSQSNVHCKGSEEFGEGHSGACQENAEEKQFDGNLCDAMLMCSQWLQSPEGTKDEKMSALECVRRQWFVVCGRKMSSAMEVKTFLSLALSYSDALLQTIVNMADADGNTALHYAVSYSNTDVIKHLLDTGFCDVSRQNKAGYTAIMLAALLLVDMERHRPIIQYLFESGNVNVPSSLSGQTALMLAASHGRDDTVRLLLSCGADVNAQDDDGSTALMCASEHGHVDVIRTLLGDVTCDSTLTDVDGSTALSIAMEEGLQEIGVLLYAHMKTLRHSTTPGENDDDDEEPKQ